MVQPSYQGISFIGQPGEYTFAPGSGGSLVVTDTLPDRNGTVVVENPDMAMFAGKEYHFVLGTNGYDTLNGTDGDDLILGFAGNDTIYGGGGDDVITGGSGNDSLHGGDGDDTFLASSGADKYYGDGGIDILDATGGDVTLYGFTGDKTVEQILGDGSTRILGTGGYDTLDFRDT
ncbi:MAG: hypothetical protein K8S55_12030, partial [Phycisphaerae bacterium]|nr:hypothetical protein [Phycisphaerae bacterium]